MTWRTHLLVGINALWVLAPLPNALAADTVGLLALTASVGALLPDFDATRSKVRSLDIGGARPLVPLADALNHAFGHRGLLHSPVGWVGFGLLCLLLDPWLSSAGRGWEPSLGLFIGYGSHLIADSATPSGIPSTGIYPWLVRRRRFHLLPKCLRVVTGSQAEDALLLPLAAGATLLLLRALFQA